MYLTLLDSSYLDNIYGTVFDNNPGEMISVESIIFISTDDLHWNTDGRDALGVYRMHNRNKATSTIKIFISYSIGW